jgi:hypothetical protein
MRFWEDIKSFLRNIIFTCPRVAKEKERLQLVKVVLAARMAVVSQVGMVVDVDVAGEGVDEVVEEEEVVRAVVEMEVGGVGVGTKVVEDTRMLLGLEDTTRRCRGWGLSRQSRVGGTLGLAHDTIPSLYYRIIYTCKTSNTCRDSVDPMNSYMQNGLLISLLLLPNPNPLRTRKTSLPTSSKA